MASEKLTTIQIDVPSRDRLGQIAVVHARSMTKQLTWMIYQEWVRLFGHVKGAEVMGVEEIADGYSDHPVPLVKIKRDGEPERVPDEQP